MARFRRCQLRLAGANGSLTARWSDGDAQFAQAIDGADEILRLRVAGRRAVMPIGGKVRIVKRGGMNDDFHSAAQAHDARAELVHRKREPGLYCRHIIRHCEAVDFAPLLPAQEEIVRRDRRAKIMGAHPIDFVARGKFVHDSAQERNRMEVVVRRNMTRTQTSFREAAQLRVKFISNPGGGRGAEEMRAQIQAQIASKAEILIQKMGMMLLVIADGMPVR